MLGARGAFVALFDDDAIYGRDYLTAVIGALAASGLQSASLDGGFHRWRWETRRYERVPRAPGTGERLAFRRAAHRVDVAERRFSSVNIGEETMCMTSLGVAAPPGAAVFLQVCHGAHTSSVGKADRGPPTTSQGEHAEPVAAADVPPGLRALLAPLLATPALAGDGAARWRAAFADRPDAPEARAARADALLAVARARGRLVVVGARGARLRAGVHLDSPPAAVLARGAALRAADVAVAKEGAWTWRVRADAGWCTLKDALLAPDFDDPATLDTILALPPLPTLAR